MNVESVQVCAERLVQAELDPGTKLSLLGELRDSIEIVQSQDYARYLAVIVPAFLSLLSPEHSVPVFNSGDPIQRLRLTTLEILHRFPQTEALKSFAPEIMASLMDILRSDNEENAAVALKVIVDLHKNYKALVEDFVQPFFDFVKEAYSSMEQAVEVAFSSDAEGEGDDDEAPPTVPGSEASTVAPKPIPRSLDSFKVLTECPIIIALLFQLHKKYVGVNVPALVPLIVKVINLQPMAQKEAHEQAALEGKVLTGMSPAIKNRAMYSELKALQIKTLSFIAYILRSFVQNLKPHQEAIAEAVIGLMKDCPSDDSATRKELLVATRHIWFSDFRTSFLKYVDVLLDENVLVSPGLTSRESLRPIAYSVLIDLLHHLRDDLSQPQIARIIALFSKNINEAGFSFSMQMICLKLLVNFVDRITHLPVKAEARELLERILEALDVRLFALRLSLPSIVKHLKEKGNNTLVSASHSSASVAMEDESWHTLKGYADIGFVHPIRTSTRFTEGSVDILKDAKLMFKSLSQCIKSVTVGIRTCSITPNIPALEPPPQNGNTGRGLEDLVETFLSILTNGLDCLDLYNSDVLMKSFSESDPMSSVQQSKLNIGSAVKEDKETFDTFSSIFTIVEPCIFQEIFDVKMQYLFDRMLTNSIILVVPQFFLASASVSPSFTGLLLRFLVDRLEQLGSSDQNLSNVMLRLFKLVFMAITLFPEKNEPVLRLFLGNLIMSSMKLSAKARIPVNYFLLLRALFRSISGGRFELLYQEVLPLLPLLFEGLNALLASSHKKHMRELFVELCLTVPVRLSVLLPFLSYLMRPLIFSLSAGPELVSQGLRTLELCVDNLTQEFLEPIMTPYVDDLMAGLWQHLKPLPYNQMHSHTAMRILGKLGGRNRRLLQNPIALAHKTDKSPVELSVTFSLNTKETIHTLSLEKALKTALDVLENKDQYPFNRLQAFQFAKNSLGLLIDLTQFESVLQPPPAAVVTSKGDDASQMDVDDSSASKSADESPFVPSPAITFDQMESLQHILSRICQCFFSSACIEELKIDSLALLDNLCKLFTLVSFNEAHSKRNNALLDDNIYQVCYEKGFLMAVSDAITSEDTKKRDFAEECIVKLFAMYRQVAGEQADIGQFPAFHFLATFFCSNCYDQEPTKKNGGCLGISILSSKLDFGSSWMLSHEMDFIKALLFVLKDSSPSISSCNLDEAVQTFSHVLKVCNRHDDEDSNSPDRQSKFSSLVSLLISELSNSNSVVRETIQSAFQLLADLTGNEVTEILTPVRDRLLAPIFAKPLRALPFAMQMGHVDAITYCLSLRPPLLSFSEELVRLIQEALALADAEDQALVSKSSQYKNAASLTNLRVVCIKLLSAAMANAEFNTPRQVTTRSRIISVFFKSLYSKSNEVVDCAYKGLQQVLSQQHKLPKDLLQAGLRPILVNLSDHKRLTVSGLEGLGRLLELLTNYFKVEIGKKLLDHMRLWADPNMLEDASGRPLNEIEDIKIIVAVLDIFRLLPASANIFMDEVILELIIMESRIHRSYSSPFRPPVIRYLNRYASEAIDYFYERILDPKFSAIFVSLLQSDLASVLRLEVMKTHQKLLSHTLLSTKGDDDEIRERQRQGVRILHQIMKQQPEWHEPEIIAPLKAVWVKSSIGEDRRLQSLSEIFRNSSKVLDILMILCQQDPEDISLLFEIVYALERDDILDYSELKLFLFTHFQDRMPNAAKKSSIEKFFAIFASDVVSQQTKTNIIRFLVVPMLLLSIQKDPSSINEIVDASIVDLMQQRIWAPLSSENDETASEDALKVELLQLTVLLIQYVPEAISDIRKDIIKFAWKHFKNEDTITKQSAYVVLARFIREYDTPVKIVVQIYVALLRAFQAEGKVLVKQALDILLPVLPQRITDAGGDSKMATWVRWTRKIIIEDGHNTPQLVMIYQLIIRHAEQFYESRDHFIPQIVFSLAKLGLSPNATSETRTLTMDIAEVLLTWERKAIEVSDEKDDGNMDWTPEDGNKSGSSWKDSNYLEMLINYLICFSLTTNETLQMKGLAFKAYKLISSFLTILPNTVIKLTHFEKSATATEGAANVNLVTNAVDIMTTIVDLKPSDWVVANIVIIQRFLEAWIKSCNAKIASGLEKLVSNILKSFTDIKLAEEQEPPADIASFNKFMELTIQIGLRDSSCIPITVALVEATNIAMTNQQLVNEMIKTLQKLVKEFQALQFSSNMPSSQRQQSDSSLTAIKLVNLLNKSIGVMGDQRRIFLQCLGSLIENADNPEICSSLIQMCREWVFNKTDAFPTIKEKAGLLLKMLILEAKGMDAQFDEFLMLVSDIYSDASFLGTELTVKLEPAFLSGTLRKKNPTISSKFASILDRAVGKNSYSRLIYVLGIQNWEHVSEKYWIGLVLDICLGALDQEAALIESGMAARIPICGSGSNDMADDNVYAGLDQDNLDFIQHYRSSPLSVLLGPLRHLVRVDEELAHSIWIELFPKLWISQTGRQRHDLTKALIPLLSKEYHIKQAELRPNVVQTLLDGICECTPVLQVPPQLLQYLGKSYNAWHSSIELLKLPVYPVKSGSNLNTQEEDKIREGFYDSLVDLYSCLEEEDMVFGLWRTRCLFPETNAALSYEQIGMWSQAQALYEAAQTKARSGIMPFSESEYNLWEAKWVECAERLQQWDILADLSKNESDTSLMLESAWRLSDWQAEREMLSSNVGIMQDNEIRKQIYESFLLLQNYNDGKCSVSEVQRTCDEGVQLVMRRWIGLPSYVSEAHIPLLHDFQLFVEMTEACQIITNLQSTNAGNIDSKSQELKGILQVWRDRLPNEWDDINLWSDIVSWRQHVFSVVNKSYLPLIPHLTQPSGAGGSPTSSYAYRGYHETAWIINRFAHVTRKHQLTEVCVNALSKIYTLPNIEIQEAFYKLREQAKCHFQSATEYSAGLDVINNTNLLYFTTSQKAEFFAMKGAFLNKLNLHEDASQAFSSAVQIDMNLPKSWGAWGQYNDRMFKENPTEVKYASNAVNCFLHASGLYNNARSRKYIARILWLLSCDDAQFTVSKAFDSFKGELPIWFWITFIPQLLTSLGGKEARLARQILMKISKAHPQALHFQLRTAKEDYLLLKKQSSGNQSLQEDSASNSVSEVKKDGDKKDVDTSMSASQQDANSRRQPWEYVEEIMALLKTAFPLLALTMETMVDQILQRLKPTTDEDIYRLIVALLNDGVQIYMQQLPRDPSNTGQLSSATEINLLRFAESMSPNHLKYKAAFEKDFIQSKPTLATLIERFRLWRDNLEILLDNRPKVKHLEYFSHYLAEFEFTKFDEVEIPGQYYLLRNNNKDFARIQRFSPTVDVIRGHSSCSRRLTIRGHDGSVRPFICQHPAGRHCRREERIVQLFRALNTIIERKKESRRRNLSFHLPVIVPLAPQIRLIQDDPSYETLQEVFEDHCRQYGMTRDDAAVHYTERIRHVLLSDDVSKRTKMELLNLKIELFDEVAAKFVPETILTKYCTKKMDTYQDLWNLRKTFTRHMACNTFLSYTLSVGHRNPQKIYMSFDTGKVWFSEPVPTISSSSSLLSSSEAVPFRLTPNLQHFMTPAGIEGMFTSSMLSLGRSLTEAEFELENYLTLYLRDELSSWYTLSRKTSVSDTQLRDHVLQNVDLVTRRIQGLSCKAERERSPTTEGQRVEPVYQTLLDLISQAVNPLKLAQMDIGFMPQL